MKTSSRSLGRDSKKESSPTGKRDGDCGAILALGKAFSVVLALAIPIMIGCGSHAGTSSISSAAQTAGALTLSSVTPDSADVASPVTVQVIGAGFDNSSVIMLNGNTVPTTLVNSTTVTTSLAANAATAPTAVDVAVSDTARNVVSNALKFYWIRPLVITSVTLAPATQGSSYQVTLTATGGRPQYKWIAKSGLPDGLTMSSSGAISGTPSGSGNFSVNVVVSDSSYPVHTASATLALQVAAASQSASPLAISAPSLPTATVSKSYNGMVSATGGSKPYTWSVASGSLPAGLSLASGTGVISGTPTTSGTFNFSVSVSDSSLTVQKQSNAIAITVAPAPIAQLAIISSSLPNGTVAKLYGGTFSATGGTTPYTWSVSSGGLPAGLSLAPATGVISGTPTASGTSSFTVSVSDSSPTVQTQSNSATITVAVAPIPLAISSSSLPNGTVSESYSGTVSASGGTNPYTWSVSSGSLPTGLSLAPATGVISGTPSTSGTFAVTLGVRDTQGTATMGNFSITIAAALVISTATLPSATDGTLYAATLSATGGTPGYTWSVPSGQLPPGLTLAATTGEISGTPSATGTFSFTAAVSDSANPPQTQSKASSMVVSAPVVQSGGKTWYVRPDGGTRYSATQTSGQCNGQADAAYPGSGTNQNCAFGDFRYLWSDGSANNYVWALAGGDTAIVRGGPWRAAGFNTNTGGDQWGVVCQGNPANCFNSPIPAGTSGQHTRILGENYGNCTTKTKLVGGYSALAVLNLKGAQFVDVQCLDLSDQSQCTRVGANPYPAACSTNPPYDDFASYGLQTDVNTHDVLLQDLNIHGLVSRGIIGPLGGTINVNRVRLAYNGAAGWDFDDGNGTASTNSPKVNASYLTVEWNGCNEEYPIVHSYPAISCYDDNNAGYGDGVGTSNTTLNFTCDHCTFDHNTQDGLDLLHTSGSIISITNSYSYANMGQQWKIGAMSSVVFRNNLTLHNCNRMSEAIPGTPNTFNAYGLSDFCRASGDGFAMAMLAGSTITIQDNSFVGYGATSYDISCPGGGCSSPSIVFQNNLTVGYSNPGYNSGRTPGVFNLQSGVPANPFSAADHNIYYNLRTCPSEGSTSVCSDPKIQSEPTFGTEASLDSVNFGLTSLSTNAIGKGISIVGIATDYAGDTRSTPPSIGSYEYVP